MHYKSKSLAYVQSMLQTCFIYEFLKYFFLIHTLNFNQNLILVA